MLKHRSSDRSKVVWGATLIALGAAFLLQQIGVIDWVEWRPMWPAILIVIGLVTMAAADRPKQVASGVSFILIGFWFYACIQHWYGLTYRTGWPLLLVVFGLEIILGAVLERIVPAKTKEEHHA